MLNVNEIKEEVESLTRGQGISYSSGEEFNREAVVAQDNLLRYYITKHDHFEAEALAPFIEMIVAQSVNGVAVPINFRKMIDLEIANTNIANGAASTEYISAVFINSVSVGNSKKSALRSGNLSKGWATYWMANNKFATSPSSSHVRITYIINPPAAIWAGIIDSANSIESYDSVNSINFIWPEQCRPFLIDSFLNLRGLKEGKTDVIGWLQNNNI